MTPAPPAVERRARRASPVVFSPDALPSNWRGAMAGELAEPYVARLERYLRGLAATGDEPGFLPAPDAVFEAFRRTPLARVKVAILGQDPYHGPGQAHGLAFSVSPGCRVPPSLRNIFRELCDDLGCPAPASGDLSPWADQGVLLLNSTLTVAPGRAGSHAGIGWERFTDAAVRAVATARPDAVFVLWGSRAQGKRALIEAASGPDGASRRILCAPHPSPLSAYRGFFGSKPFSGSNRLLRSRGVASVEWAL